MNSIEAKDIVYSYEKEGPKALNGLSFSLPIGKYIAVIGHNGSGKSTLAKIIAGLINDFQGELTVFGEKMDKNSVQSLRKRMGLVFQNPDNQFVGSTVRDDIAFGLENRRVPSEDMEGIIRKYAEEVGMLDYLDKSPENLSGGQKQRVAIAGILAMNPDLVIYDEATSMLDPVGKKEILDLTKRMREKNPSLTILSITHDIEEAYQADYVLVLNKGKLILEGSPKDVFSHKEELSAARLDPPFIIQLIDELKSLGMDIPDEINSEEELEDYLCR